MKKLVVLFSIIAILCWVPAVYAADSNFGGSGQSGATQDQDQGGAAILDDGGNTIGGSMGQESQQIQKFEAGGSAHAETDCIDCVDGLNGQLEVSKAWVGVDLDESTHQGQAQIGAFGHLSIDKQEWWEMERTKSGSFNMNYKRTDTIDKDIVVHKDSAESSDLLISADKSFDVKLVGNKTFTANADATYTETHETDNTANVEEIPDDVLTTDTYGVDGHLDVSKDISGELNVDKSFDLDVDYDETGSENFTLAYDKTEVTDKTLHTDYENKCLVKEHHQKTLTFEGNGVAGVQFSGGSQSGSLHGGAFAMSISGGIDYDTNLNGEAK